MNLVGNAVTFTEHGALPGPSAQTRLLALTADSLEESGAACSSAGLDGVLVKPVRGADVRRVLGGLAVPTAR